MQSSHLVWDPSPVAFTIPYFDASIYIYGICFVLGFVLGYYLLIRLLQGTLKNQTRDVIQGLVDQLTWFVIAGTIIGARLGHVFFYDWDHYKNHLLQILNVREGGLASHGGTIGVLIALGLFYFLIFHKKTGLSFLTLLDHVVVPTALVAFFIRLGNFFNQEILGTPTDLPWAIIFATPADHSLPTPRHPAQLYEGFSYLIIFTLLLFLWYNTSVKSKKGFLTGLFFVLIFGARFFIEFIKEHQHSILDQSVLQTGQILSVPFIVIGIVLMGRACLYDKKYT